MQKIFTIILLTLGLTSYGQRGSWIPFKLVIIQPDTAFIDASLNSERDSIVATQLRRYYQSLAIMEELANCVNCPGDSGMTEKMKVELVRYKSHESEAKKFKFYYLLSSYSAEVYNMYFNEYEPYSTIIQIPSQKTDLLSLKMLSDTSQADYIVFYDKIRTQDKNGLPILKLTTSLYSRKSNKIILRKETEGDTDSRGEMWTCNYTLSCLLINGVRTSTDAVANILRKRQIRQK